MKYNIQKYLQFWLPKHQDCHRTVLSHDRSAGPNMDKIYFLINNNVNKICIKNKLIKVLYTYVVDFWSTATSSPENRRKQKFEISLTTKREILQLKTSCIIYCFYFLIRCTKTLTIFGSRRGCILLREALTLIPRRIFKI